MPKVYNNASAESVLSRLVNASRSMEVSHQAAATRYVFERFLVRLGECEIWNKRLALKGAMALIGLTQAGVSQASGGTVSSYKNNQINLNGVDGAPLPGLNAN
ncbi:hypothetical protein [Bradyrhizobium sp. LA2.1]|uniref:hypothetical protein n=1 Tax=Bradyrhizobium sp. LA2.1 TaxID=3156376 RepID=UPI003396DB38